VVSAEPPRANGRPIYQKETSMNNPHGRRAAAVLVVAYLALTGVAGVYLAEGVVRPGRVSLSEVDRQAAVRLADAHAASLEDTELVARDGVRLRAWLFTPAANSGRSVLVLHGQGSSRAGMVGYIDLLIAMGLQVLAPDARAHGDSEGTIASYGVVEADDVRRWADLLRSLGDGCVYGFAESMGAGTLLQALDGDPRFCGVVVESPFASFREVAYDRIGSVLHAGPWLARTVLRPVVESGVLYVHARHGVDLGRANPMAAMRGSKVPVLLIHGTADTSIPPRHSRLLAAARPAGTRLWEVPGAEHCGAIGVVPLEFERRVRASFDQAFERSAPPRSQ
jgi:uncharacterized protein